MSAAIRFLCLTVVGWAGIRAATLAMLPAPVSGDPLAPTAASAAPVADRPLAATLPPLGPIAVETAIVSAPQMPWPAPVTARPITQVARFRPATISVGPPPAVAATVLPGPISAAEPATVDRLGPEALTRSVLTPPSAVSTAPIDRLRVTSWALVRDDAAGNALATGGTLGGSQAGVRLAYRLLPGIDASLRASSALARSTGAEIAAGLRLTPSRSIPVALTVERRQGLGKSGGRSAFALFVEGGVYRRPMIWGVELDGYAQAGVVGARSRDLFGDGALTLTRQIQGPLSAGAGVWAGAQPQLYRMDAGPRLSLEVRPNVRFHLDWRQRVAGEAQPDSGPALTVGADF